MFLLGKLFFFILLFWFALGNFPMQHFANLILWIKLFSFCFFLFFNDPKYFTLRMCIRLLSRKSYVKCYCICKPKREKKSFLSTNFIFIFVYSLGMRLWSWLCTICILQLNLLLLLSLWLFRKSKWKNKWNSEFSTQKKKKNKPEKFRFISSYYSYVYG